MLRLARKGVAAKLIDLGETFEDAERLAQRWVTTSNFLLSEEPVHPADFVVGNPPYVRLEDVPREVSDAYRSIGQLCEVEQTSTWVL